jgi:hypothetical protein
MLLPDGTPRHTKDFDPFTSSLVPNKNFETFTNRNCTEGLDFVGREYTTWVDT